MKKKKKNKMNLSKFENVEKMRDIIQLKKNINI